MQKLTLPTWAHHQPIVLGIDPQTSYLGQRNPLDWKPKPGDPGTDYMAYRRWEFISPLQRDRVLPMLNKLLGYDIPYYADPFYEAGMDKDENRRRWLFDLAIPEELQSSMGGETVHTYNLGNAIFAIVFLNDMMAEGDLYWLSSADSSMNVIGFKPKGAA